MTACAKKGYEREVDTREITLLQEGKKVSYTGNLMPGWYDIEINRDGYLLYKDRIKIDAAGDLKTVKLPLQPMEREIVIAPNYDIAPPELKPDKAYLKNLAEATREIIPITRRVESKARALLDQSRE